MAEQVEVKIIEDKIPILAARVESTCRAAVKKVADAIASTARDLAPVETGDLRDSIESTSIATGREAEVTVGVDYAGYREFGTRYQAATPYLGPAVDQHEEELVPEIMIAFEAQL